PGPVPAGPEPEAEQDDRRQRQQRQDRLPPPTYRPTLGQLLQAQRLPRPFDDPGRTRDPAHRSLQREAATRAAATERDLGTGHAEPYPAPAAPRQYGSHRR